MSQLTVAAFALACLFAIGSSAIATSLCFCLFAIKQLLQGSAGVFRDSLAGSQSINVIIALVSGIAGTRQVIQTPAKMRGFLNPTWYLTMALYLWALTSCVWSYAPSLGFESFVAAAPYLLLFLVIVPLIVTNIDDWRRVTGAWFVISFCVAALILLNPDFTMKSGRLGLDLGIAGLKNSRTNPLETGTIGGFCILLGLLYSGSSRPTILVVFRLAAVLVGTALAVKSGSRGQFFAAVIAAALAYPVAKPVTDIRRTVTAAIVIVVFLGVVVLLADQVMTSGGFQDEKRWSSSGLESGSGVRFENIFVLLSEYANSPGRWLTGLGFYSFSAIDSTQDYSHCISVDMLAELGVLGFVLYLAIIVRVVKDTIASLAAVSNSLELRNALGCLVGLLIYQFLLANKQGNLLGSCMLFTAAFIMARIRRAAVGIEDSPLVSESRV